MRVLHLRPRFRDAQRILAPRGSAAWEAVVKVLRAFGDPASPLPGEGDRAIERRPFLLGRPVPETDLFVYYVPGLDEVYVIDLVRRARQEP